jgi:hypothetical protein
MSDREYDVFISYARENQEEVARPLASEFQSRGFKVWLDKWVLNQESKLEDSILAGLQDAFVPVVILSHDFLRKEWPRKELEILLAIEQVDDRQRIVTIRHNISDSQLQAASPFLAARTKVSTSEGVHQVCSKIIDTVTEYVDRGPLYAQDVDSSVPLARFFAPGLVKCPNARCTWRLPDDAANIVTTDPGPEFTLTKKGGKWYLVCASCDTLAAGPLEPSDAKWILTFVRMNIYAPTDPPYLRQKDGL